MISASTNLSNLVREAGYQLIHIDQLRTNRWLIVAESAEGRVLVLAQQRPLISASDVQDLAERLRLSQVPIGYLLAMGGRFSPEAQRTAAELRRPRIVLCGKIPSVDQAVAVAHLFETI
ncbi:hypothetical protein K2Z83_13965 [Oscillochloris sp. ZM17-4]|uniref:hypothetical protein n=1 Tax=Oscillochloris sp. ZM17-4 TaxID=2866714 RepID=UPI001C731A23|nr:hypothetical protein [Oscillochloris sp. ZM17-4]MBX0328780.1 hypothetical protein [Oscillochloris sp. ZM17-4]